MTTAPESDGEDRREQHKTIYRRYIDLLNEQDFAALPEVVDPDRYQEICVGFTPGWVQLPEAISALRKVLVGIPDLHAEIDDLVAENDRVYARLTVTGTNRGRLFGVPPSGRRYQVQMFDYARLEGGKIVERVQQSDTFGQMRQLYAPTQAPRPRRSRSRARAAATRQAVTTPWRTRRSRSQRRFRRSAAPRLPRLRASKRAPLRSDRWCVR